MRSVTERLVFVSFVCGALGCATAGAAATPPSKPIVTVRVLGATVGPTHTDGTAWDGDGRATQEAISGLRTALGTANPAMAVASFLAGPLLSGIDKPDACGWAELRSRAEPVGERQILLPCAAWQEPRDTFTPDWPKPPEWKSVELNPDVTISVHMEEFDTLADGHGRVFDGTEPMGVMTIRYCDLMDALKANKVHMVPVHDQTNDQVLFVKIEVLKE